MKRLLKRAVLVALAAAGLQSATAEAAVVPQKEAALADKSFRQPELYVPELNQPLSALPALAAGLQRELADLGVPPDSGLLRSAQPAAGAR